MSNTPHKHHLYLNGFGYDDTFIEAAHYERQASYEPMSPAQTPLDGTPNVEMYASKDVPVLALPTLYCMVHGTEHPCAYTHTVDSTLGICDLDYATDPQRYVASERVAITAQESYTGRVTRA